MDDLFPPATTELLDRAMRQLGLTSDYKLALALSWRPSDVSKYRTGRICMSIDRAAEFSKLTGIPLEEVAAAAIADKQRKKRNQTSGSLKAA